MAAFTPLRSETQLLLQVGPNVQVSKQHADREHAEVLLGANPENALELIACSMESPIPGNSFPPASIAYVTFDGGATWQSTKEIPAFSGDPTCVYGPHNIAYFGAIADRLKANVLVRSTDGGRTWQPPVKAMVGDRDFVEVDTSSKRFRGRVYFHSAGRPAFGTLDSDKNEYVVVYRSLDEGRTLAEPTFISSSKYSIQSSPGVIMADGTLVLTATEYPENAERSLRHPTKPTGWIYVIASSDGGKTFGNGMLATSWYLNGDNYLVPTALPSIAADTTNGPFLNRLYLVWNDWRFGRSAILLSYSDNKGKKWSDPVLVSDTQPAIVPEKQIGGVAPLYPSGADAFTPAVAVNRDGIVGVTWYDRRSISDKIGSWVRFAASRDGGETFSPSVRVSSAPSAVDPNAKHVALAAYTAGGGGFASGGPMQSVIGPDKRYSMQGGDTAGLVADANGEFHSLWADNRTGVAQMWTAVIHANGWAIRNGSPEVSALSDVTANVDLTLGQPVYDQEYHIVTVDARLKNTSRKMLRGPFKVRVTGIGSWIGTPSIVGSDNGEAGIGAVWSFTVPRTGGLLKPGAETQTRELTFRIDDLRVLEPDASGSVERYITMSEKVFGSVGAR